MAWDLVVTNARIVDGTGGAPFVGDVAVKDGKIAEIGTVTGDADRSIDAEGRVLAPGFIDAHTHYDGQLLWDPWANPAAVHGVTTVLMGNCGYTLAPVRPEDQEYLIGLFAATEEIPKGALEAFAPLPWESFPEYLDKIEGTLGINAIVQVGHSAVRRFVMGEDALDRAATPEEIAEMVRVVEEAMDAGAAGVSSSHAPHQRGEQGEHIPTYYSTHAEILALADAVKRKGRQLVSINPATKRDGLSDEDRAFLVEIAETSETVVSWNDFGLGTPNGDSALAFMEEELANGHRIYAVARCQRAESRFTLKKLSAAFAGSDDWVDLSRLDPDEKLKALADPEWRARLAEFWKSAKFLDNATVEKTTNPENKPLEGRLLNDIAAERGCHPSDVMFDTAISDELGTYFLLSGPVNVDESRLERILKSPATLVGISDGGAHLQTFAGGDYPSYFLQHWVREKGSFTLEEAVAALSREVAEFCGLTDRGTIEVGKAADLVIFDPDSVGPLALETLDDIPGGGQRMTKQAQGIPFVIVNGVPIIDDGKLVDALPGQVVRAS
jgi:N-acyl-D-aspartate/D-glutamate deacylase